MDLERTGGSRGLRWLVAYLVIAALVLTATFLWMTLYRPLRWFRIPTGAMIPTLLIGDVVAADMRPRAVAAPARGDVVVFEAPGEPEKTWVKRVIALPGEVIEIRDKAVYINGRPLEEPYKVHETEFIQESWNQVKEGTLPGGGGGEGARGAPPRWRAPAGWFDFGPYLVPEGSYFIMGDNRDNSRDSRSFGAIPASSLRGQVTMVWWSRDQESGRTRWRRIGRRVR